MDIKEIQNLIKFVSKSGVNEVSIEQGEFKITIKSTKEDVVVQAPAVVQTAPVQTVAATTPLVQAAATPPPTETTEQPATPTEATEDANLITIKSPMIGTFYRRSSPDKDPFVNIGDSVAVGDVLCIVEAMKLFNEIESEVSGKVVKVLVDDTTPIEYDQPLFLIDPS
jgi:acetyl-CoA carboxylase biotin carboxyl carrier protein